MVVTILHKGQFLFMPLGLGQIRGGGGWGAFSMLNPICPGGEGGGGIHAPPATYLFISVQIHV